MIWLTAATLTALVAVVVPILLHLVARRPAERLVFPTLRFLDALPLRARARRTLSDWPLLLVRVLIVAAGVVALAQPVLLTTARRNAAMQRDVRALIIDTSRSMQRRAASLPDTVLDEARRRAAASSAQAFHADVHETDDMAEGVRWAGAWLATAPAGRQVVSFYTDGQAGSLPGAAVSALPPHVGVEVHVVDNDPGARTPLPRRMVGSGARRYVEQRVVAPDASGHLAVESAGSSAGAECDLRVRVESTPREQAPADALREAVVAAGVPCAPPGSPELVLVLGTRPDTSSWTGAPPTPAMLRLVSRMVATTAPRDAGLVAWGRRGDALEGRVAISVFDDAAPRVVGAAFAAYLDPDAAPESDPRREPRATLAAFERPPSPPPDAAFRHEPSPDGRYVWAVVLILLIAESWLRRGPDSGRAGGVGGVRAT